jgi:hypothetical protein
MLACTYFTNHSFAPSPTGWLSVANSPLPDSDRSSWFPMQPPSNCRRRRAPERRPVPSTGKQVAMVEDNRLSSEARGRELYSTGAGLARLAFGTNLDDSDVLFVDMCSWWCQSN